jgi:hypothetical protein
VVVIIHILHSINNLNEIRSKRRDAETKALFFDIKAALAEPKGIEGLVDSYSFDNAAIGVSSETIKAHINADRRFSSLWLQRSACIRMRCPVRGFSTPNRVRFALRPVIGTAAWAPHKAQQARSGGNNRMIVSSSNSNTSPGRQKCFKHRTIAPFFDLYSDLWSHRHSGGASISVRLLSSCVAASAE